MNCQYIFACDEGTHYYCGHPEDAAVHKCGCPDTHKYVAPPEQLGDILSVTEGGFCPEGGPHERESIDTDACAHCGLYVDYWDGMLPVAEAERLREIAASSPADDWR